MTPRPPFIGPCFYTSHAAAPQQPAPWCSHPSHPPPTFSFWHTVSCGTKKLNCSLAGRPVAGAAPSASAALGCSQGRRGPGWSGLRMGGGGHGGTGASRRRQRVRRHTAEHDPSTRRTAARSQDQQCHPGQRSAPQQGQAGAVKRPPLTRKLEGNSGGFRLPACGANRLRNSCGARRQRRARDRGTVAHCAKPLPNSAGRRCRLDGGGPTPGPGAAIGGAQPSSGPLTSLLSSVVCCQALLLLQMLRATPTRPSTPRAAVLSMAIRRAGPVKVGLGPQAPPKALAGSPVLGCCTPCWRPSRNLHTLCAGGNPSSGEEHGGQAATAAAVGMRAWGALRAAIAAF